MTVISFLIILAVLIFVHELGHFVCAKLFGIRVDEFAIGFPPHIFSWKKGETKYSLNLIPFGGYVKIFGENPDEESISGPDKKRSFVNARKWKQIIVLLSGIFMNLIFAWILLSISFQIGFLTSVDNQMNSINTKVMITSVLKNSPADLAGLREGDVIFAINNQSSDNQIKSAQQVQQVIGESSSTITIEYQRGSATSSVNVIAKNTTGKNAIGISMANVGIERFGFFRSIYEGGKMTIFEMRDIAVGLYKLIIGLLSGQSSLFNNVAGPVGIATMVGQASELGISNLLGFIALISINLAVLNCIPFPALDGGRAFFVLIEAIIRRRIKPIVLNWANGIGFALLILLMIFVTYKDIIRLIK